MYYGGVNVVCILDNEMPNKDQPKILLIENLRIPTEKRMIEFPAGLCETGWTLAENAEREVEEETGFKVKKWMDVDSGVLVADPYNCTEQGCTMVGYVNRPEILEKKFDNSEEIEN